MIRAVVERDGGVIGECVAVERDQMAIREALVEPGVDIILLIGGTGGGSDDHSAAALAEAGAPPLPCPRLPPRGTTRTRPTPCRGPAELLAGHPPAWLAGPSAPPPP